MHLKSTMDIIEEVSSSSESSKSNSSIEIAITPLPNTDTTYQSGDQLILNYEQSHNKNEVNDIKHDELSTCEVKLDTLTELKHSTKKLLCLLDEIQANRYKRLSTNFKDPYQLSTSESSKASTMNESPAIPQVTSSNIIILTEAKTSNDKIIAFLTNDPKYDCTVYKRLTRQCHCLNQEDYNDFIVQFNGSKYITSTIGEIIKNLKIVKKFLYMGGDNARRALMFLNEGLSDSKPTEKLEITQGCAHADICNVFDDPSIVTICILWPSEYSNYGDTTTQALAASLLYKLSQSEEGQRYLKFSSKIIEDSKKVLTTKSHNLDYDTIESLNATLSSIRMENTEGLEKDTSHTMQSLGTIEKGKDCNIVERETVTSYNKTQVTIQAFNGVPNFTLKRPRIVPIYTD